MSADPTIAAAAHAAVEHQPETAEDALQELTPEELAAETKLFTEDAKAAAHAAAENSNGLVDLHMHVYAPEPDDEMRKNVELLREELQQLPIWEHIQARAYCTNVNLRRFLRARGGDITKAKTQLLEALTWRMNAKPWTLRVEQFEHQIPCGKMFFGGYDQFKRPIIIMDSSRQPPNTPNVDQINYVFLSLEHARYRLAQHGVEKWCIFFNLERFSLWNSPPLSVCSELVKTMFNRYPEHLGHAILWQAPMVFSGLWHALKGFLDPRTARKINFVSGNSEPGSDNDKLMTAIFGSQWRIICDIDSARDKSVFDGAKYIEELKAMEPAVIAQSESDPTASMP